MPPHNGPHIGRRHPRPACADAHCDRFERLAVWTVRATGGRWGFRLAVFLFIGWMGAGPYFNFHESWTTAFTVVTTSVTFLLVFLIQNAQNRETKAIHLKLDELIYAGKNTRNELIHIEHMTEEQLDILGERYRRLAEHYYGPRAKFEEVALAGGDMDWPTVEIADAPADRANGMGPVKSGDASATASRS